MRGCGNPDCKACPESAPKTTGTLQGMLFSEMEEFAKENGFEFTIEEWPLICKLQRKLAEKNKMSLIWTK